MENILDFDETLTDKERASPTFLEWDDATLARGVRVLATQLHDDVGFQGITGVAAGLALEKIARDNDTEEYVITIDGGTRITVRRAK